MPSLRQINASQEAEFTLKHILKKQRQDIYSFFPIDRAYCECKQLIHDYKMKLAQTNDEGRRDIVSSVTHIECPRDKSAMTRYKVVCRDCGEIQAYLWATNNSLEDWCDCHYTQWHDGSKWHGCFTPHISPITEQLCFECTCGNDTRDFTLNKSLPGALAAQIEEKNKKGRAYGKQDSKFLVQEVKNV